MISGAQGFVGKHLSWRLEKQGEVVIPFEGDVTNAQQWQAQLEGVDRVFHLAAKNRASDDELRQVNIGGTQALVEAAAAVKVRPLVVFASSFQVYDNAVVVDAGTPPAPVSLYGQTKVQAEQLLVNAPFPAAIVRISNVFGVGCRPFYNSVVATWMELARQGKPLEVDRYATRDLIWVEDVVNSLIAAVEGVQPAASGELTSLYEVAAQIATLSGAAINVREGGFSGPVWHQAQPVTPVFAVLEEYWASVKQQEFPT